MLLARWNPTVADLISFVLIGVTVIKHAVYCIVPVHRSPALNATVFHAWEFTRIIYSVIYIFKNFHRLSTLQYPIWIRAHIKKVINVFLSENVRLWGFLFCCNVANTKRPSNDYETSRNATPLPCRAWTASRRGSEADPPLGCTCDRPADCHTRSSRSASGARICPPHLRRTPMYSWTKKFLFS